MVRFILRIVGILFALALLAGLVLGALVHLPQANGLRQRFADYALSRNFGREIEVNGPVIVDTGEIIRINIEDISVFSAFSSARVNPDHIKSGSFSIPLKRLVSGTPVLTELKLSGASYNVINPKDDQDTKRRKREALIKFPSAFLKHRLSAALELEDVTLQIADPDTGLDDTVHIAALSSRLDEKYQKITISGEGDFNGRSVAIDAVADNPRAETGNKPGALELDLKFPGSQGRYTGTIDVANPVAELTGDWRMQITSLGEILDAFQLQRVIEGDGKFSAHLSGPINHLAASDIESSVQGRQRNRFAIAGNIPDISSGDGLELQVTGNLGPRGETVALDAPVSDYRVTAFSGEVAGRYSALKVDELVVSTNAFSVSFREIGPISIGRIAKDPEGRLGVRDIRILDGPEHRRTLDLSGEIVDALTMTGIDLKGSFDLDTRQFLSLEGGEPDESLGYFKGQVAISDKDGSFGVNELTGSVNGSELIEMELELVSDGLDDSGEIALDADIKIPRFGAFLAAIGRKSRDQGRLEFVGRLSIKDELPAIRGELVVGDTLLDGALTAERNKAGFKIVGAVQSKALRISDLRQLWDVRMLSKEQDFDYLAINESVFQDLELDVEINAEEVADAGESVGNMRGRLAYADRTMTLDPLVISYLGGTIDSATTIDLSNKTPSLSTTGKVSKLQVGKLLDELALPRMASGTLNAKFDLTGTGDIKSFAKSASGSITASLWNGNIGTNRIDLTGMDYISWAATRQKDDSTRITCAILPMSLKGGLAATSRFIIETENVLLIGEGMVDLNADSVDIAFQPLPKSEKVGAVATQFAVTGPLSAPKISVDPQEIQQRMVSEMFAIPMNMMTQFFDMNSQQEQTQPARKPCTLPEVVEDASDKGTNIDAMDAETGGVGGRFENAN